MQRLSVGLIFFFFLKLPVFDGIPWKDYILDRAAHGPHRPNVGDESRALRALFEPQHCFFQKQETNNLKQKKKRVFFSVRTNRKLHINLGQYYFGICINHCFLLEIIHELFRRFLNIPTCNSKLSMHKSLNYLLSFFRILKYLPLLA